VWVGTNPPSAIETSELWKGVKLVQSKHVEAGISAFEDFLTTHPTSPWVPSLRANLGRYKRQQGRYSPALEHWEAAWESTKQAPNGNARQVADYAFAYWTRLLASLGRKEQLGALLAETQGRLFDSGPLLQIVKGTYDGYDAMVRTPEICYKCGTYALRQMAFALKGPGYENQEIASTPSPETGFSMTKLVELADRAQLGLVPVRRSQGTDLVVPSVIHWRQNHYATIVEQQGDSVRVIDPTFGKPQWLSVQTINSEASGIFLIPEDKSPKSWVRLTSSETDQIFGKGKDNNIRDEEDDPCNGSNGNDGSSGGGGDGGNGFSSGAGSTGAAVNSAPGGGSGVGGGGCGGCASTGVGSIPTIGTSGRGAGPGGGGGIPGTPIQGGGNPLDDLYTTWGRGGGGGGGDSDCQGCQSEGDGGMARWRVSEPYISLWLSDTPIGYQPALGRQVEFRLSYKQRGTTPVSTSFFSAGPQWNLSWMSYFEEPIPGGSPPAGTFPGTLHLPGGGIRYFNNTDGSTVEYYSYSTALRLVDGSNNLRGFKVSYPNGSTEYYLQMLSGAENLAFLTARVNPMGITNRLEYATESGVLRLKRIVDGDGQTNILHYDNLTYANLVTEIDDPYGRTAYLYYNSAGQLTNITDVINLASRFSYDPSGVITNLVTPYGTNTFRYTEASFGGYNLGGTNMINRSLLAIAPDGGSQLYLYRDVSDLLAPTNAVSLLPSTYAGTLVPTNTPVGTLDNSNMDYRNSFHWATRQYAALSTTNMFSFTTNDYCLATLKHWLHNKDYTGPDRRVSGTLSMLRAPSPDALGFVWGQMTWYDYSGKTDTLAEGNKSLPNLVAQVLPDGSTWYMQFIRNSLGHVITNTSTYTSGASIPIRSSAFLYDANGVDPTEIIGPDGHVLDSYVYDGNHRVLRATNAVNDVVYLTYNAREQLTGIAYPTGLILTNYYDPQNQLTNSTEYALSGASLVYFRTNSFTYANRLLSIQTDERAHSVTNTWDNFQRLLTSSDSRGTNLYAYSNLDLVSFVDRLGNSNTYVYDQLRRLTAQTNALGRFTLYNYCNCGALDSIRDAEGNLTQFYYDNLGRRTRTSFADGFSVTNSYSLTGQLTNTSDTAGSRITNWFNNQGLAYAVSNAFGRVRTSIFDIRDRTTNSVDANGVLVTNALDDLNRVIKRGYPDGGIETFGYSSRGLIAFTNQLGLTNFYAYDEAGRKILETNANWEITQFHYDPSGNLTILTDAKSQSTSWHYDQFGLVTNKVDAANNVLLIYRYDAVSRLTNRTSAAKGSTAYQYDATGNLTNVDYPVSPDLSLAYDAMNRLTNMVDAVGTSQYTYDPAGQILSEDGPWNDDTVSYTYANRLRTGMSLSAPNASPSTQTYSYDFARRLTNVTSPAGVFSYSYDSTRNLQVQKLLLPNTAFITNTFDSKSRLTSTLFKNSGGISLAGFTGYGYDALRLRSASRVESSVIYYDYDSIGQLATTTPYDPGASLTNRFHESFGYRYDAAGNLNYRTNNALVEVFNVNLLNELTTNTRTGTLTVAGTTTSAATNVTINTSNAILFADNTFASSNQALVDGNNTFTAVAKDAYGRSDTNVSTCFVPATNVFVYDLNGNTLSDGRYGFDYDDENQLIRITLTNGWKSEFTYDGALRRRIRKEFAWQNSAWLQTNEVRYIYDGLLAIQERGTNNLPQVSYTRGNDLSGSFQAAGGIGGLLARTDNQVCAIGISGAHAYYFADGNGNVTALIDTNQLVAAKYLYDPFGTILSMSGQFADSNHYRFSSKERDPSSGMYYYGYRFYDPELQRWTSRDALGELGGVNVYEFCVNSPVSAIDPVGLQTILPAPPAVAIPVCVGLACAIIIPVLLTPPPPPGPTPVIYPLNSGPRNGPPRSVSCDTKIIPFPGPTRTPSPAPTPDPDVPLPPGYEKCKKTSDNNDPDPLKRVCSFTCSDNVIFIKTGKLCDADHITRKIP
jgi:RHS repeat-associated protein